MARDAGGPEIVGQLLVNPVTDSDMSRPSYSENADGYILTKALMEWFWDHYMDGADRADPTGFAPARRVCRGLPPAVIVTSEFDPLRDEGAAYARGAGGGRRRDEARVRSRPHAHVADDGRRRALERAGASGDGRSAARSSSRPRFPPDLIRSVVLLSRLPAGTGTFRNLAARPVCELLQQSDDLRT